MNKYASVAFLYMALLWTGTARAIAPGYLTDEELARSPIIVEAKWEKAACTNHDKHSEGAVIQCEAFTKLHILRTVKGPKLAEGDYELMFEWQGIAWFPDGTGLNSGTSTMLMGDVDDITKPNLWFLERKQSWDETRTNEYLSANHYRQVQPPILEKYYLAMGSPQAEVEIPRLLTPDEPEVAERVLRYIAGGILPWPYDPDSIFGMYVNPKNRGKMLVREANRVWGIVQSRSEELRPTALGLYAELKGKDCRKAMRTLLDDKNPLVRGIASGVLARYRDEASLEQIQTAVRGVEDGPLACKLIAVLSAWKDQRVVPALITFLQNDVLAYQTGDDLGIPALKAQQALKKITGHLFPFDVDRSMAAWQKAIGHRDAVKRRQVLEELAPTKQPPFLAELIGEPTFETMKATNELVRPPPTPGGNAEDDAKWYNEVALSQMKNVAARIRIRNITNWPMTIARRPADVSIAWEGGCSNDTSLEEQATGCEFSTLAPSQSLEIGVKLDHSYVTADPTKCRLTITYYGNGKSAGVTAWIGMLEVSNVSEWLGKCQIRTEERWPNGNLKVTGVTINGHKIGKWNHFNEQGDRVKIVFYGQQQNTITCDPDIPENKGVGRIRKDMKEWEYTINNHAITVRKYTGFGGVVAIPEKIHNLPVTFIGRSVFRGCDSVTNVTIPASVPSIGEAAFDDCDNLASITIPNSVTNIGKWAFDGCTNLTSVTIGNGVIHIGDWAFSHCYSLTNATIPDSVTSIGDGAFQSCHHLTSVSIGSGLTNLGGVVFYGCTSLTGITVDARNSISSSVDGVLFDKKQTTIIHYPEGKKGSYSIPSSVTSVGNQAFELCTNLTKVTIPASVTNGAEAFNYCTRLTGITVDAKNPAYSSRDGVLFNKSQTTLLQCPAGKAGSYTVPGTITTIGSGAFNGCHLLTRITIPASVTTIGDGAFWGCTKLTKATIPNSVARIEPNTFCGCDSLADVEIGNGVTNIADSAFASCYRLTNILIPATVTSIGDETFRFCTNLTSVCFQGNAPSLGKDVFFWCEKATIYHLPGTKGWRATFGGCPTAVWKPAGVGP